MHRPAFRSISCFAAILSVSIAALWPFSAHTADQTEITNSPASRYEFRREHDRDGIGKFYMGREIAQVMGHEAANWLERPEREKEENPGLAIASLKLKAGDIVADIGAGSGYYTRRMAQIVGESGTIYAVDIQQEMLDLLTNKMAELKLHNVKAVLGTITDPRLPPATLDLALLVDVYHEFDHPYEMVDAICHSLKPGGRLVFVEFRGEDPNVPIKRVHKMTASQIKKEMAVHPLEWVESIETLPWQHVFIFKKIQKSRSERGEIYFPPPESQGGWRKLAGSADLQQLGGMQPDKLTALKRWLLESDQRDFAAVVMRHGYVTLEVERRDSASTDSRRVASVSKAICASVLAIASEQSQQGLTPRRMQFDDPAFQFIPWAEPLSDPRKRLITVKQLLNHTSGICPESTGAPNDGSWDYILGHTDDERTARLAFAPGTACGYSTHALHHAALVCETVTGMPYDQFAIKALFKALGIEHWSFQFYEGSEKIGRHPSHSVGMPARDLARIAYCMLHEGRWEDEQVIPKWFVAETAHPTHDVRTPELRWKFNPQIFTHGWELPAYLNGEGGRAGKGIPTDAREKPGSGGQLIAFVPSLDLVVTRQTGGSGDWPFEEYLRRACAACEP